MRYQLALSAEDIRDQVWHEFAGVGLLRGEYILRKAGIFSTHPQAKSVIRAYLEQVCRLFPSQPVWYRFSELEVAEANALAEVDHILPVERNPVIGLRGVRRAMRFPDSFGAEIDAILPCLRKYSQLGVIVPFVGDPSEVVFVKTELTRRGVSPPFGMMAEIPAAILRLEDFLKLGVECVLIGMNDLTGLALGIERGKDKACFRHPAMRELISMARAKTTEFGVTLSVAGYIDRPFLRMAADIGVDYAILHYSSLNEIFPEEFPNLPEQHNLRAIKEKTKRMIADFEATRSALTPRAGHMRGTTSD
ncbi:MAG: putative PEP-binding protein [Alphaproteobacteria bacterium]